MSKPKEKTRWNCKGEILLPASPRSPHQEKIDRAFIHIQCAMDCLEGPSVDDYRLHLAYEHLQSAWNSVKLVKAANP